MITTDNLRNAPLLRVVSVSFIIIWCLMAAFPIVWITVMSFKLPVDAFSTNPLEVILGTNTIGESKGFSWLQVITIIGILGLGFSLSQTRKKFLTDNAGKADKPSFWVSRPATLRGGFLLLLLLVLVFSNSINDQVGFLGKLVFGLTMENYRAVWVDNQFYENFINSLVVTLGVVTISLSVGVLAGYALARVKSKAAFWILIIALIFRSLPHSILVAGYLPFFINSQEILSPILGEGAPTLYGQPLAVILVLVSINQPFTIWMLKSFFENIPHELDESARVDGCSTFKAFYHVIIPVMWPGVITTGLFSFLLAYNDYLVTSLLLDVQNQTMVPAIVSYFNRETTSTDQVEAVAAAVSIIAPLLILVLIFQKQIVSGLTQGAVKG